MVESKVVKVADCPYPRIMAQPKRPPPPRPPTKDTPEVRTEILARLSKGESLRRICADPHLPNMDTFLDWCAAKPDLSEQYARARARQADYYAEQIVEIADHAEDANLARLQIDARKWVAARLLPKKWGDKQEIEHSGKIDSIIVNVTRKEPPK